MNYRSLQYWLAALLLGLSLVWANASFISIVQGDHVSLLQYFDSTDSQDQPDNTEPPHHFLPASPLALDISAATVFPQYENRQGKVIRPQRTTHIRAPPLA